MDRCSLLLVASLFATSMAPALCWGQCPDAVDRVLIFPGNQASGVPTNAVLRAEFPPTRDPGGVPHWMVLDDHGQQVEGEASWDGSTSTFTPAGSLDERSTYTARVTAQATGDFWQAIFATGSGEDRRAPQLGGVSGVSWTQRSESWLLENCRLARGDGFVFTLDIPDASDDATPESELCRYVYLTEGPGADDATPIARLRQGESSIRLMRAVEDGEGDFCFRVAVRDLSGRFDGNHHEECVEAIAGAIFEDVCSTAGPRPARGRLDLAFGFLVLTAWLVLRRHRRERERGEINDEPGTGNGERGLVDGQQPIIRHSRFRVPGSSFDRERDQGLQSIP